MLDAAIGVGGVADFFMRMPVASCRSSASSEARTAVPAWRRPLQSCCSASRLACIRSAVKTPSLSRSPPAAKQPWASWRPAQPRLRRRPGGRAGHRRRLTRGSLRLRPAEIVEDAFDGEPIEEGGRGRAGVVGSSGDGNRGGSGWGWRLGAAEAAGQGCGEHRRPVERGSALWALRSVVRLVRGFGEEVLAAFPGWLVDGSSAHVSGPGGPETGMQERGRRLVVLNQVQRQVEPVGVADDDRAVRVVLGGGPGRSRSTPNRIAGCAGRREPAAQDG